MGKRPIVFIAGGMAAGIASACFTESYLFVFIAAFIFTIAGMIAFKKSKLDLIIFILIVIFYIGGALQYLLIDAGNKSRYSDFSNKEVLVTGMIDSEPDIKETKVSYVLNTFEIECEGRTHKVKGKILFSTPLNNEMPILEYGRNIKVSGVLNLPMGVRNPGGFDYRQYLAKSGICASIFAGYGDIKLFGYGGTSIITKTGLYIRNRIISVINRSLPPQQAGLLCGMLIGYTSGLGEEVQQAFSDAGLSHLTAVSGMNVAFIVAPLLFLFKKLHLRQKTANIIIIFILILFVSITGFTPSVVRAVIMAIVVLIGQIAMREPDIYASIALAAIILFVISPYNMFDVGFLLSFGATLSLVMFYKPILKFIDFKHIPGFIKNVAAATIAAQIGTIPITAFFFNKVSLISLLSNILAVPLVEVITILGFIMAIVGQVLLFLSQLGGYINCIFLSFILFVTKLSASFPGAIVRLATPHVMIIAAYYTAFIYMLWLKPKYKLRLKPRVQISIAAILVVILVIRLIPGNEMKVVFIDVGEGDSTFIRTYSGKTILIDGGGYNSKLSKGKNIGDTVISPFLFNQGLTSVDLVIASHAHDDHIQGLFPVLKIFRPDNLIIPDTSDIKEFKALITEAKKDGVKVNSCKKGDIIKVDKYTYFEVLYPWRDSAENTSLNNTSIVLKLHYKNMSILFPGDIEKAAENALLDSKADLSASVLKVAHHGSISSTSIEFLEKIRPLMAVVSVGKNNFGHPSMEVLGRLEKSGASLFRTDECGAVVLITDGNKIKVDRTVRPNTK